MNENPAGKSSIGIEGNVAAALGYPIGLLALILLLTEKENKFVRYHAIQSLLWIALFMVAYFAVFIGTFVIGFLSMFLGMAGGTALGILGTLVFFASIAVVLLTLIGFIGGMIYSAVKAYQGERHSLPLVGKFASKWA